MNCERDTLWAASLILFFFCYPLSIYMTAWLLIFEAQQPTTEHVTWIFNSFFFSSTFWKITVHGCGWCFPFSSFTTTTTKKNVKIFYLPKIRRSVLCNIDFDEISQTKQTQNERKRQFNLFFFLLFFMLPAERSSQTRKQQKKKKKFTYRLTQISHSISHFTLYFIYMCNILSSLFLILITQHTHIRARIVFRREKMKRKEKKFRSYIHSKCKCISIE